MVAERRTFLKAAAVTAASYQRIHGANDRIRLALLGAGGRGSFLAQQALQIGGTELTAICDVNEIRLDLAREKLSPAARSFQDHRAVLDLKDIDACIIGSPDHWHVPMTIDAVQAGKDAYVEKPLSHSIEEGERCVKAVAASKRIVQVGYQQRSWDHFREARELVASGRLGKITLILISWYQPYERFLATPPNVDPAKVDWKRFLGSARDQPFDALRCQWWRWFWDFGGGHLTDLCSHYGDVVNWAMNVTVPEDAVATGHNNHLPQFECPDTVNCSWHYKQGFDVAYNGTLIGNLDGGNLVFRGANAMMKLNRDGFAVYPEGGVAFEKTNYPEPELQMRSLKDGGAPHVRNFLDCVRSRKRPNAPVDECVHAAHAAHMGNLALRHGKPVRWPV